MSDSEAKRDTDILLEVCVDQVASAVAAAAAGAGRLELCCGLVDGGLTPSLGLIEAVVKAVGIPVNVLIRPRPGDFVYDEHETAVMEADIRHCKAAGVNGVVIGALTPKGNLDKTVVSRLVAAAADGLAITFHRAIDVCADPEQLIRECVELGITRILTSGQQNTALAGAATIAKWQQAFPEVIFMAGSGVTAATAASIVAQTRIREIHATARTTVPGPMEYRLETPVYMGGEKVNSAETEYARRLSTIDSVSAVVNALHL